MGAPKKNQFWKQAAKYGREKMFQTPEILWNACEQYFQWCDDNPLIEIDFKGKDATRVRLPKMRAYTWAGLELFLGIHSLRDYKTNEKYKEYSQVVTRVEKIIYTQKFTGAAAGFLNPNIIAYDLGMKHADEHRQNGDDKPILENGEKLPDDD